MCSMPWACSLVARLISDTRESVCLTLSLIFAKESPTPSRQRAPSLLLNIDASIFCEDSWAAAALLCARDRTSSATTAKPEPASPARAASTAALRARILVWKAISSILFTILPTSLLDFSIAPMATAIASRLVLPRLALTWASLARVLA